MSTTQNAPSPGGQVSRMADTSAKPGSVGWRGGGIPSTSRGLPRGSPGARLATSAGGEERLGAPGEPRGRAVPGRRLGRAAN
jgi:hypothetical protein